MVLTPCLNLAALSCLASEPPRSGGGCWSLGLEEKQQVKRDSLIRSGPGEQGQGKKAAAMPTSSWEVWHLGQY